MNVTIQTRVRKRVGREVKFVPAAKVSVMRFVSLVVGVIRLAIIRSRTLTPPVVQFTRCVTHLATTPVAPKLTVKQTVGWGE